MGDGRSHGADEGHAFRLRRSLLGFACFLLRFFANANVADDAEQVFFAVKNCLAGANFDGKCSAFFMLVRGLEKNIRSTGSLHLFRPILQGFRRAQLANAKTLQFFGRIAIGLFNSLIGGDNDAVRI